MCLASNACSTCVRNCFLMHKRKHNVPLLGSAFFKIMFGKNFDNFLAVPPAFSKRIRSLVGRKIFLQDSSRRQWDVSLISKNGSLFFQKGWRNFVQDHDIRMGDLLVFYYCKDSDVLVEVFGRSGCQQRYGFNDKTPEAARSSVPTKRPRDVPLEQSSRKKYMLSSDSSDADVDVFHRPRNVPAVEEPVIKARKASTQRKAVVEPMVEPCFMASLDQNRRKAFPEVETLAEPCFVPSRDENVVSEPGRECLFDLSAFEMPSKKSTTMDGEEETGYLLDLPAYELPQNETCGEKARENNQVSSVIAGDIPTMHRDDNVGGYLLDKSVFEIPENECTIVSDKGDLQEKLHGRVSNKCQNTAIEDASDDIMNHNISEKPNKKLSSESREAELRRHDDGPITSSSPTLDLPSDLITPLKIVDKADTSKLSAVSDESKRRTKQELKEIQDIRDAMADCSFGHISTFNEQANISSETSLFSGKINPTVKIEADINPIVKLEPVDYDAPSEIGVKITCPVPPGTENFLVLPEPLPLTVRVDRRRTRPKQLLVFLRDCAGRVWPVVYHNKSGFKVLTSGWKELMKANGIQPGDECTFTVENSEEGSLSVHVVHRN